MFPSPDQVKTLLSMGAEGVLIFCQVLAIWFLWKANQKKDDHLEKEREKREELIEKTIEVSMTVVDYIKHQNETLKEISEALRRIEVANGKQ